jgi:tripartite-type tricarboxylate transporter receptor subunit TctC
MPRMMHAPLSRRLLIGAALALPALRARGETWPDRPLRLINPWPVGGPSDLLARPLMQRLNATLGKPLVMENRPGANGTIATALALRAPPDGYTILLAHAGPMTLAPVFQGNIGYDPVRDAMPVTQLVSVPTVLVTRLGLGATDLASLIAIARAAPKPLSYASVGPGSTTHLAAEMLSQAAGVPFLHVPYTGSTQAVTDMLAERIDFAFFGSGAVVPHIEAGRLKALAVSTLKRLPRLPSLPAVAETYPGFEMNSWYGIAMPLGTPAPIIERLAQEFNAALHQPETTALLLENGMVVEGTSPAELAARISGDLQRWRALAQSTGIRIEP